MEKLLDTDTVVDEEELVKEEAADKLGMVVYGELEPESMKVPLPVWQSQVATVSDSQQKPIIPQASEMELYIPPGMS